ncbi:MAG: hypothetical protein WBL45_04205 [Solirubrobacterales bacterium]
MAAAETNTRSSFRVRAGVFALVLAAVGIASSAPAALADPAGYEDASANGENVFFTTTEKLVPGDTDNKRDVYERFYDDTVGIESYVTREVSTGPAGGNDAHDVGFGGISDDGFRVFFSTAESLVSADKDLAPDLYMRNLHNGATIWISRPDPNCSAPSCGNAPLAVSFDAVGDDGTQVVFSTEESLNDDDVDSVEDVYVRDIAGGETKVVSEPAPSCALPNCGDGAEAAFFAAASADALTVAFGSGEPLSGGDGDLAEDIYVRDVGTATTSLVSAASTCPAGLGAGECTPIFGGISDDGSHVFYETGEQVAAGEDNDEGQDVYGYSGGAPELVSTGPEGAGDDENATYAGTTADGSGVFFKTGESLLGGDGDNAPDVYMRSGSATELISTGPDDGPAGAPADFERASPDGDTVIFSTAESLIISDTDAARDIYGRDTGADTTTQASLPGSGCTGTCGDASDAGFAGASKDAAHVFFETSEPLVGVDGDSSPDIYRRSGSQTTLVSTSSTSKNGASSPHLTDVAEDASHALFTTGEKLTSGDVDAETDVYDRVDGETLLVSTRNPDELVLGPATPELTATNPPSPGLSTEPHVLGEADSETSIKIYATADCSGTPVATGTSADLEGAGILVKVAPSSTSSFHATATLLNDTSACSLTGLTYQQASGGGGGTGGGGGETGSGGGSSTGSKPGGGNPGVDGTRPVTPHTRITFAPAAKTRLRRPSFQFVDSTGQSDTRFLCAVDRGRWRSCTSPTKLQKLTRGRHVFKVKGVNSGFWEAAPVTRAFKVVRG